MANPALNEKILNKISASTDVSKMTINGTINKTGLLILFTILGAYFGWNLQSTTLLIGSFVVSLILAFTIIFGPQRAPYLSQAYAISEGLLLGSISSMYSLRYPGIVSNALFLTIGCLLVMLGLYRFKVIQVTDKFRSVLIAATFAVALTYLINMVMVFFGTDIPMIHQSTTLGIGFSVVVVVIAALNLLLDFDMIEKANAQGAPRFMEWYGGFALLVTLVWLYLEILRLLSKLNKK